MLNLLRRGLALVLSAVLILWAEDGFATNFTVNMQNFAFVPKNLTINLGDTVTWVNLDGTAHDTVSGTNGVPSGVWQSALLGTNQSFSFTFSNVAPGGYGYYCTPHVFSFRMIGSITVVAPNQPPSVTITTPSNGSTFSSGQNITIEAAASDPDGTVTRVDFFVNGNPVGSATSAPFRFTLNNVSTGDYVLSAVAVDNGGATSPPSTVNVKVELGNIPPLIAITNPVNGQAFFVGTNILIEAVASDQDGTVSQVEFFLNDVSVGLLSAPPYSVLLTNLGLGDYSVRAVAKDNLGAFSTSTVLFSVVEAAQPPIILHPPQSQVALLGSTVSFTVSASGTGLLLYQWLRNGAELAGATNSTLLLTNVQASQAGVYSVIVSNSAGSVVSEGATLLINAPPMVSVISPANDATFNARSDVILIADASDPDGHIAGVEFLLSTNSFATNSIGLVTNAPFSLLLSNVAPGTYFVVARTTDDLGAQADSVPVRFFVRNAPVLTRSPADESVPPGTELLLEASIDPVGAAITNVLFLAGTEIIGEDASPPFSVNWSTNRVGDFQLFAVTLDEFGQAGTSAPVALRISVRETTRPTIGITNSPDNFSQLFSAQAFVAGIARDDVSVDRIEYQLNGGAAQVVATNVASPSASWSVLVTNLSPGVNTLRFRSIDLRTNVSFDAIRYFTYVVVDTLHVEVEPGGTVTPQMNGQRLEIGKAYSITARAGPGYLFTGWGGISNSAAPKLTFMMQPNLKLVAKFATNPFPAVAGGYSGLFFDTNNVAVETSGMITLQVTKSGSFSGKLGMAAGNYAFRGQLDGLGKTSLPVLRQTLTPVVLALQFDFGTGQFFGFVTNSVGTNGALAASQLSAKKKALATSAQVGKRPFVLKVDSDGGELGAGNGSIMIARGGGVQIRGVLTDGPKFTATSALLKDGTIPFYLTLNSGNDVLIGWVLVGDGSESLFGTLSWARLDAHAISLQLGPPE